MKLTQFPPFQHIFSTFGSFCSSLVLLSILALSMSGSTYPHTILRRSSFNIFTNSSSGVPGSNNLDGLRYFINCTGISIFHGNDSLVNIEDISELSNLTQIGLGNINCQLPIINNNNTYINNT